MLDSIAKALETLAPIFMRALLGPFLESILAELRKLLGLDDKADHVTILKALKEADAPTKKRIQDSNTHLEKHLRDVLADKEPAKEPKRESVRGM